MNETARNTGIVVFVVGIVSAFMNINPEDISWEVVKSFALEHIPELLAGSGVVLTSLVGFLVARHFFKLRNFLRICNVSFNMLLPDELTKRIKLQFRTLLEKRLLDVLENKFAEAAVLSAARALNPSPWWKVWQFIPGWTRIFGFPTQKRTFIRLKGNDHKTVLKNLTNALSELSPLGPLYKAMGLPTTSIKLVAGLNCEWQKSVWNTKTRAMVIRLETLVALYEEMHPEKTKQTATSGRSSRFHPANVDFEAESHEVRLETLQEWAELYHENPNYFAECEIILPLFVADDNLEAILQLLFEHQELLDVIKAANDPDKIARLAVSLRTTASPGIVELGLRRRAVTQIAALFATDVAAGA